MFDIAPSEFLLVAIVALVVIGPKDLPKALRVLGYWVGKARGVARQFRSGFDNMVREAELAEMEKKWAAENERIMKEHGADTAAEPALATTTHEPSADNEAGTTRSGNSEETAADEPDLFTQPVMVAKPVLTAADAPAAADAKASS